MKLSINADELAALEDMKDEDLVRTVRDSLAKFRAGSAADDLENADPSSAGHGGRSIPTIETVASRSANTSANDAARAAHRRAANDMSLTAANRAAHRLMANDYEAQSRRDAAHAKIVPGIDRL
jgi:hypothetical protein